MISFSKCMAPINKDMKIYSRRTKSRPPSQLRQQPIVARIHSTLATSLQFWPHNCKRTCKYPAWRHLCTTFLHIPTLNTSTSFFHFSWEAAHQSHHTPCIPTITSCWIRLRVHTCFTTWRNHGTVSDPKSRPARHKLPMRYPYPLLCFLFFHVFIYRSARAEFNWSLWHLSADVNMFTGTGNV